MEVMDRILKVSSLSPVSVLNTPSGRSIFEIQERTQSGVRVIVGKQKKWRIHIPAECWEGIPNFLRGRSWVLIGAVHEGNPKPGSLDSYVQRFTHGTSAASYVAPILEKAGIVKIDRGRPNKVLLLK